MASHESHVEENVSPTDTDICQEMVGVGSEEPVGDMLAELQVASAPQNAPANLVLFQPSTNITNVVDNRQISCQQTVNQPHPMQVGTLIGGKHNLNLTAEGHSTVNIYNGRTEEKPCHMPSRDNIGEEIAGCPTGTDAIPHVDYNDLMFTVMERFEEDERLYRRVKYNCRSNWGTRHGIPQTILRDLEPEKFIECLEQCQLLGPYNMDFLYQLMQKLKQIDLTEGIAEYKEFHASDRLENHKPNGTIAEDTFHTEVVLNGDISQRSNRDVERYKEIFEDRFGIPKSAASFIGTGEGSVVLVFQLPLRWLGEQPGGIDDIDVLARLTDDVSQRADWLMDSDVIGIHIEGRQYVDLTGVSPKDDDGSQHKRVRDDFTKLSTVDSTDLDANLDRYKEEQTQIITGGAAALDNENKHESSDSCTVSKGASSTDEEAIADDSTVETILSQQKHSINLEGREIRLKIEPVVMESNDDTAHDEDEEEQSWVELNYYPDPASSEEEDLYSAATQKTQQPNVASPQHYSSIPSGKEISPSNDKQNIRRDTASTRSSQGGDPYGGPSSSSIPGGNETSTSDGYQNVREDAVYVPPRSSQGGASYGSPSSKPSGMETSPNVGYQNVRREATPPRSSQGGASYGSPSSKPSGMETSPNVRGEGTPTRSSQGGASYEDPPYQKPIFNKMPQRTTPESHPGRSSNRYDHRHQGQPLNSKAPAQFRGTDKTPHLDDRSDSRQDQEFQGGSQGDYNQSFQGQPHLFKPGSAKQNTHYTQDTYAAEDDIVDNQDDGSMDMGESGACGANRNIWGGSTTSGKSRRGLETDNIPGKAHRVGANKNDDGQKGKQWRGKMGRGGNAGSYHQSPEGRKSAENHSSDGENEVFTDAKTFHNNPRGGHHHQPRPGQFSSERPQSQEHAEIPPSSSSADEKSESQTDEGVTIEVSKFKTTTSEDTLRMYFESRRKSGGGDIDVFDICHDILTITFLDPAVADRVVRRTHKLEGATLTVIPVEKKKERPLRPVDKFRLLLTDIPDGVEHETLMLFIEGRTKIDEDPKVVYGERPGTAMIQYSSPIKDINAVILNFSKRKLKGVNIRASNVEFSDCILVQNLKPETTVDTVELYFENERKSGGGIVREVQLDEEKNQAIVYFEDWKVVERVTSQRRHELSKYVLTVTVFEDCLGSEISTDGPTPQVPKPCVVQVDPEIAGYVMGDGSPHMSRLEQELQKVNASIEWPPEQKMSSCKLTPDISRASDPGVWRDWTKRATTVIEEFFQEYKADEFQVDQQFWEKVCEELQKLNLNSVRPVLRRDNGAILLLGLSADVKHSKNQLASYVDDLEKIAERERQIVTKRMDLRPEKVKLLVLCRITDDVERDNGRVNFRLIPDSNEVQCQGMASDVAEACLAVYAKLDLLKQHTVEISANKSRFMDYVLDKIHEIFASKNIRAACNIEGCKLTVSGSDEQATQRALVYIKSSIVERNLKTERDATINVLQSPKGIKCLRDINNQKAALTVVNVEARQVEITGFKNDVENALAVIGEFIEKHVILERRVPLIRGKVHFLTEHYGRDLKNISEDNQRHMVQIKPIRGGRQSGFLITATEQGMEVAMQNLKSLIKKVVDQQLPVNKPGIPRLLRQDKGKRFLKTIEKDNECIVDTNSTGLDSFDEDIGASIDVPRVQVLRQHAVIGGCQVLVCKGDLTTESVDAIVNAANTKLEHVGGLAKAIVDAGGEIIQKESFAIIREKGRELTTGEVVVTSSGKLQCRHLLHVAGPRWDSRTRKPKPGDDPTNEENLLYDCVTNVLREANRLSLRTLSIPAISSGVYGFPIHLCAKTVVEATVEFCKKHKSAKIKEVRFTNIDQRACDAFLTVFRMQFGEEDRYVGDDRLDSMESRDSASEDSFASFRGASGFTDEPLLTESTSILVKQADRDTITTNENKTITMKKGNLAAEIVDVIVNTTSSSLKLSAGGVSKAILVAAGAALQQECQNGLAQSGQTALGPGGILETGPAALKCKTVYHTVCEHYQGPSSEAILSTLVMKVLQQADQTGYQSISLPAIGTGNLRFPRNVAAKLMYEAAIKFSQQNAQGSLVDIRFVVYHRDRPTIQAFEAEVQSLLQQRLPNTGGASGGVARKLRQSAASSDERPRADSSDAKSFKGYRESAYGTTEMKIGPIRVQIGQGDLTRESTEVIVNSVGENLDLGGPVSKAIIKEGGHNIKAEIDRIRKKGGRYVYEGVVKTRAGTLNCDMIIHVAIPPNNLDQLKDKVYKALKLAEKEKCKSIAFPALGTGNIGGDPATAASALLDAIGEFACREKVENLLLIKLTIFQPTMLFVFQSTMNGKEGDSYKAERSIFQRGADLVKWAWSKATISDAPVGRRLMLGDGESRETDVDAAMETMILHIFAGNSRNLQQAKDKIEEFIEEEFSRDELMYESEVWGELSKKKLDKICAIGRQNTVSIQPMLDGRAKRIVLEGRTVDVMAAKNDIQKYFTDIQLQKKHELEDQLMNKDVQWRFKDPDGQFVDYGDELNPLIERAYRDNRSHRILDLEGGRVRIDFGTKKEQDLSGRKADIDVERVDLKKASSTLDIPANWIPMGAGQNSVAVKLVPTSAEYQKVEATFLGSIGQPVTVKEIKRIQNTELLKQYRAKKERLQGSVKAGVQVERELYHGTHGDNCDKINTNGFNRSFHGANGTALGKGTYFALNASYSNGYAKPTPSNNNYRHMYVCKVLTGEYAIGNSTMIAPPAKPGNAAELYDSVVDQHPAQVYVVFHDAQAFPEYLIAFA